MVLSLVITWGFWLTTAGILYTRHRRGLWTLAIPIVLSGILFGFPQIPEDLAVIFILGFHGIAGSRLIASFLAEGSG